MPIPSKEESEILTKYIYRFTSTWYVLRIADNPLSTATLSVYKNYLLTTVV
jgi:hypothetical protein